MNQQAFAGGIAASPFLPLSLPAGMPAPPVLPGAPMIPYAPQNHLPNPVVTKEEHSDNDQVSLSNDRAVDEHCSG